MCSAVLLTVYYFRVIVVKDRFTYTFCVDFLFFTPL